MNATDRKALWLLALRQRSVWLRACKLGLSVGLLQATVNQGDVWLRHAQDKVVVLKTIASPLIAFTLVLVSSAATWVQNHSEENKTT